MPDGIDLKRIIDLDPETTVTDDDYTIVDSTTGGAKKFAIGQALGEIKDGLEELRKGVPTNVRQAIYALFEASAYEVVGLDEYINTVKAWSDVATSLTLNQSSVSISGAGTYQLIATTVPSGLTVSWASSDESVATVNSIGLVTSVGNGTATITATVGYLSATCDVTVSGYATITSIEATYTQSGTVYTTDSLNSLKDDLVVTAYYDDTTSAVITSYTLSGELTFGISTILVAFGGKTDTFDVTVDYGLPTGYTRYDYVKNTYVSNSDGYNSAVFTGLNNVYGSSNYEHYLEFAYDSGTSTTDSGLFGLRKQAGTPNDSITIWQKYVSSTTAAFSFAVKGYSTGWKNFNIGEKNTYLLTYSSGNQKLYVNDELLIDEVAGSYDVSSEGEFALFKAQTGTSKNNNAGAALSYDRIYKYTVKNISTGVYEAYMIPCKNENGVAGLYDAVRENFYTAYGGASRITALDD